MGNTNTYTNGEANMGGVGGVSVVVVVQGGDRN